MHLKIFFLKHPALIRYFNLIRQFLSLKKNLSTNFNRLFSKSPSAFESISGLSIDDMGYEFYKAVQKILTENE